MCLASKMMTSSSLLLLLRRVSICLDLLIYRFFFPLSVSLTLLWDHFSYAWISSCHIQGLLLTESVALFTWKYCVQFSFVKNIFAGCKSLRWQFFPYFKDNTPLSSGFQCFLWEISHQSMCFSWGNGSFLLWLLFFGIQKFYCNIPKCSFLGFFNPYNLWDFFHLSVWLFFISFTKFLAIHSSNTASVPSVSLLWDLSYSDHLAESAVPLNFFISAFLSLCFVLGNFFPGIPSKTDPLTSRFPSQCFSVLGYAFGSVHFYSFWF